MNAKGIDLNLLRVFAAVDAERNVSKAAARLGLTQPAMSNALARLRKICGDPLFVRTPIGMEPTSMATDMAPAIHDGLLKFEKALDRPRAFNPTRVNRRFRLLMSDAGQLVVLPTLMRQLSLSAQGVTFEAIQMPREQFLDALQSGTADLAVSHLASMRAGIHAEALFEDTYCCVASQETFRGPLTLQHFAKARHVAIASGNAEAHVDRMLAKKHLKRDIALTVTQYHIAIECVRATSLVATVPCRSVHQQLGVRILELPIALPKAQIRQYWHTRTNNDPANQWLRSFLRTSLNSSV
jgi:DNA-binding transcriptional LysR family regulator